jgi:hypothetical protein
MNREGASRKEEVMVTAAMSVRTEELVPEKGNFTALEGVRACPQFLF